MIEELENWQQEFFTGGEIPSSAGESELCKRAGRTSCSGSGIRAL
jgi:hypothetical protein